MAELTKSVRTIRTSNAGYFTYRCVVTENSYSVANNTSNVTITFSIKGPWSPAFYEWTTYYGILVDGTVKKTSSSAPYIDSSYVQLLSWTGNISHNSDGSKSINVGVYLYQSNPATYLPIQYTSSSPLSMGSVTLTTIPRKSSISFGEFTMDSAGTITINRASSSFTHTITYAFGSKSGTIATKTTSTSVSWTPKISDLAGQIPNAARGQGTLTVTTYSGSTSLGSNSYTFYCNLPASVKPTVGTITLTPQTYSYLIQGKNKLKISVSGCSAGTGSSIKSYTFSGTGISYTGTSTSVTSSSNITFTGTSNKTLTYRVTVTDNRNRSSYKDVSITCYAYSTPSITLSNAYRVVSSTSTTESDNGTYVRCTYDLKYSSVNSSNDVTVKILYKKNTANSWSSITSLTDSTSTSGSTILSSISASSTYTVYATITDNYSGSSSSSQVTIFSAARVLNITSDGTGMAIGKMAESTELFESRYKVKSPGVITARNIRPANANTSYDTTGEEDYLGTMEHYLASTSMTSNKPSLGDGHILHFHWDNTGGWDSQLYLRNQTGDMMTRGCNSGTWGSWNAVQYKPTILYNSTTGNNGTITLSQSAANFTYLEIFYTDNNSRQPSCVKAYSPNGKYVSLSCIEPSTSSSEPRVYIRTSGWTISGTSMTPGHSDLSGANRGVYGQFYKDAGGTNVDVNVTENNYIKIYRVLGYA